LNKNSRIVEVAANDGYLLHMPKHAVFPVWASSRLPVQLMPHRAKGIEIIEEFLELN